MSENPLSPAEQVALAESARAGAVAAARRPVAVDAALAALAGLAVALVVTRTVWGVVAGVLLLAAFTVLGARATRRKGAITDGRAVGVRMGLYLITFLPAYTVAVVLPDALASWWLHALAGLAVAVGGFVFLRLEDRYQARRLASGDYGPYDLS